MQVLMNSVEPAALEVVWNFFSQGGWFMVPILACSLVAVAVVVYKVMTLGKGMIIPAALEAEVEKMAARAEAGEMASLESRFKEGGSSLARLCAVAFDSADRPQGEVQEVVQSAAREEIVNMHSGMPILEVVITIAPLLGLLGTTSGLVLVFANVGQGADPAMVGQGIAMALNTTVAGLVVAVPAVIAHSHFNRKIETMSARLEVLMGKVVARCQQYTTFNQ